MMRTRYGTHGVCLAHTLRRFDLGPRVFRPDLATLAAALGLGLALGAVLL